MNKVARFPRPLVKLARQGLDRVLAAAADNPVLMAQARFAECELLVKTKEYAAAVEKLNSFINDYPNYTLMLDAKLLYCTAASEAGRTEKDSDKRKVLFDTAISAMKDVKKRRTTAVDKAQADIEIGRIMSRKAKAEAEFGTEARAEDFRSGTMSIAFTEAVSRYRFPGCSFTRCRTCSRPFAFLMSAHSYTRPPEPLWPMRSPCQFGLAFHPTG